MAEEGLKLETEFGEELKTAVQEAKDKLVEEEQERLNSIKEKREKAGLPVIESEYEVDADKIKARIPEDFLMKLIKMRLSKNDCMNRGYLLYGVPKTYKQAELIFKMLPAVEEGQEEPDEETTEKILNKEMAPNSVVVLEGSDEFLMEIVRGLSEKVVENTHFNEKDM